ncbi:MULTISPECIES: hypothetical protein [Halostella]|uniref:DUF7577 domain-containing protein n=1 Tax=Halostella TaxID=1843185 RepID=UPI001080F657|nr:MULTISPECIES: hypothetical protein [Halostella]
MESFVTVILYVGVVMLVPLLVVIPLLLLEYLRSDDTSERRLAGRSTDTAPPGHVGDSAATTGRQSSTDAETVSCRSCGTVNESMYTFCWDCADPLAGR